MNQFQRGMISIAAPYLIEMVKDVILDACSPEGVIEFRDKILDKAVEFVEKTDTHLDDMALSLFTESVLTPENFEKWGKYILDEARQFILHTETKWDDYCLPLIDTLESILSTDK